MKWQVEIGDDKKENREDDSEDEDEQDQEQISPERSEKIPPIISIDFALGDFDNTPIAQAEDDSEEEGEGAWDEENGIRYS